MARNWSEVTASNLLRKPLVLGVPFPGLAGLGLITLILNLTLSEWKLGTGFTLAFGLAGYVCLRVFSKFALPGWEEVILFWAEERLRKRNVKPTSSWSISDAKVVCPDTLDQLEILHLKEEVREKILSLGTDQEWVLKVVSTMAGVSISELSLERDSIAAKQTFQHVYSLYRLPVFTDPLWIFPSLSKQSGQWTIFCRVRGLNRLLVKRRIEHARRQNARDQSVIGNIDAAVTFAEATQVLEELSRGSERVVEAALVIASDEPLDLDPDHFIYEKRPDLAIASVTGRRWRFHRSHWVRSVTASDLLSNIGDPAEPGIAVMKTRRNLPLYFCPQDSRLESLHWLVAGASGTGKSFLTGLILKRLLEAGRPMSVLFVDHHRSFRRLIKATQGPYSEPETLGDLQADFGIIEASLNQCGKMAGVELSDLCISEKREATRWILSQTESFLKRRKTSHVVYVVMDECWNFMRDEPVLVQRFFREFRKLNGAAVAITQSLSDFLSNEAGQSIFQNAPIRILLRQGEDVEQYQGILGLNATEAREVRSLKQRKGVFSECLVKTPYLSCIGRLFPTAEEYALLRTDNLRAVAHETERSTLCGTSH